MENIKENLEKAREIVYKCKGWNCYKCPLRNDFEVCDLNKINSLIQKAITKFNICSKCGQQIKKS